jgi:hypothetical protein
MENLIYLMSTAAQVLPLRAPRWRPTLRTSGSEGVGEKAHRYLARSLPYGDARGLLLLSLVPACTS